MNLFEKNCLPQPIIPEHPDWEELYYKAFEIGATKVRPPRAWNPQKSPYIEEGFNQNLFQWDSCFMMHWCHYLQGAYSELPQPMTTLNNFYSQQHKNGAICRELIETTGKDFHAMESPEFTNPPLFSWTEWIYFLRTGDDSRLEQVLPILDLYFEWCCQHRTRMSGHYWWDNLGSGMDNSPRNGHSWIDYTACSALDALHLYKIAFHVGRKALSQKYQKRYEYLKSLVNQTMWDVNQKFYWDLETDGSYHQVMTIASFWPLLATIPTSEQARALVNHLNSSHFKTSHRVPTLAANHSEFKHDGHYWQGSVWPPTNYMVIKGLEYNGYHQLAYQISRNHLEHMASVYSTTNTIWENYSPTEPKQGSLSRPDFCGWSAIGPIALLIENIIGIKKYTPTKTIEWHINLNERHGIKNLQFNQYPVDLIFMPISGSPQIEINTSEPLQLKINFSGQMKTFQISSGIHMLSL